MPSRAAASSSASSPTVALSSTPTSSNSSSGREQLRERIASSLVVIGAGRTWASIATLLRTAKMNDIDPFVRAWLALTLQRIVNGWPTSEIDALWHGTTPPGGLNSPLTLPQTPPHPRNSSAASDNAARPGHHGARRRLNTDPAGDREMAAPDSSASITTCALNFDHMDGSSSRTRCRHRSSHRLTNSAADSLSPPTPPDRASLPLTIGSPSHALVLASSERHTEVHVFVHTLQLDEHHRQCLRQRSARISSTKRQMTAQCFLLVQLPIPARCPGTASTTISPTSPQTC